MLTKRPLALPNNARVLSRPPKLQNRVFNGIMVLIENSGKKKFMCTTL